MLSFKGENESQVWSPVPIIEVQNIQPIRRDHEMENEDHLHTLVSLQFLVPSSLSWALIFRVGCHALLQGNLSNPGMEPRSPAFQVDSLPTGPPGKPLQTERLSLIGLTGFIFPWNAWHLLNLVSQCFYMEMTCSLERKMPPLGPCWFFYTPPPPPITCHTPARYFDKLNWE